MSVFEMRVYVMKKKKNVAHLILLHVQYSLVHSYKVTR